MLQSSLIWPPIYGFDHLLFLLSFSFFPESSDSIVFSSGCFQAILLLLLLMGGKSAVSKVRLNSGSDSCFGSVFVFFVVANSFPRALALILTYPLFLDAIFIDGYNLLLLIASVPGSPCFMVSFKANNTLSIAFRLSINVSLWH